MKRLALLLALASVSHASLLVPLDPAEAAYDGIAVDDGGAGGSASGIGDPNHPDGFVLHLTFTPDAADLSGTVLLMEIGGTSNGSGLYLVDGVPTFIGKQGTNDGAVPTSLNDTTLPAIAVQSSAGRLAAGNESTFAATWDHAGTLHLGLHDGTALETDTFSISGDPSNWSGNDTLSVGIQTSNPSTGGLSGNNPGNDPGPPFDVELAEGLAFPANIRRALYWNDHAAITTAAPDPTRLDASAPLVTGTTDVTLSWTTSEITDAGSVEITSDKPIDLSPQSGTATDGEVVATLDGSLGDTVLTATFRDSSGDVAAVRRRLVEGETDPSQLVRPWLGPDWFSSPMFDWQRTGERLECLFAGPNRRVDSLPRQLQPASSLDMSVDLVRLDTAFDGLLGFRFAARGERKTDYRHNIVRSLGLDAGLDTDGRLVLDGESVPAEFPLGAWRTLRLTLTPNRGNHDATLELIHPETEAVLASVSTSLPSSRIVGNLLLLSDAEEAGGWGDPVTAFRDWSVTGSDLAGSDDQRWGPILWTQYTLSRGTVKLSAQFAPLGVDENRTARLEIDTGSGWTEVDTAPVEQTTELALFRVENWTETDDAPFRVVYEFGDTGEDVHHEGVIRHDPVEQREISIAGLACMTDPNFPNEEIAGGVAAIDPDVLFFSGDQYYENDYGYTPKITAPFERARLDMLRKWFMFGWTFRDVLADRPAVIIVDDHDNWMANLWGSGGQENTGGLRRGGYIMPAAFVNATQRVQAAHLPDPFDFTTVDRGIEVYYTDMLYGRVSMAILEDRKFKHGPAEVGNGPGDVPLSEADLLGERQLEFVDAWARDWAGADMKVALCETPFDQVHTHASGGAEFAPIDSDQDANGWPQPARNDAVRRLRKGFPVMVAGDNHLPTLSHLGIDAHEDAFVAYSTPASAAGFPRKWDPANDAATDNTRVPGSPDYAAANFARDPELDGVPYLGRFTSDFGHPQTIVAIGNPETWGGKEFGNVDLLARKSSGFGVVRFDKKTRETTFEAYPIDADFSQSEPEQFADWPVTVPQQENYGRAAAAYLPPVENPAFGQPVVEVIDEATDELLYAIRARTPRFRPHVFEPGGSYTVRYGAPESDEWVTLAGLTPETFDTVSIESFTATRRFLAAGESIDLRWDTPGAESVTLSGGPGDVTARTFNGIGTVAVSPTIDTTYTLVASAGTTGTQAQATIRVFPDRETWNQTHFTPAELADPAVSGDDANPDGDRYANLIEYLLQLDPRAKDPALNGRLVPAAPGVRPEFTLPEPLLAGYRWQLESSADLATPWTPLENIVRTEGDIEPATGTPRIILSPAENWPAANTRQFLRARLVPVAE